MLENLSTGLTNLFCIGIACRPYINLSTTVLHGDVSECFSGDLFDEGKWCSDSEFQHHVSRFHRMFHTPSTTQLYAVVGNHDIGFHYMYGILYIFLYIECY